MPRRAPLTPISTNQSLRKELSPGTKQRVWGRALAGQSGPEIAAEESLKVNTVNKVIKRVNTRRSVQNTPRSGRPREHDIRDDRIVIRYARLHPKCTYEDLRRETGLELKRDTLRSILRDAGIMNWRSRKRPALTTIHARLRFAFALANVDTDWSRVIFSDECSVEKGVGKQRRWSFGYPSEKWDHDKIDEYPKGKQGSVMVWGAIAGTFGRSDLVIMERDGAAQRGSYTSISYMETIEEGLLPIYDGETFMQDNAPIHKSRVTIAWFAEKGIYLLPNWPPYSPDLNPIEHLWPRLKELIYKLHPELLLISAPEAQKAALVEHLPEAWQKISPEVIRECLESMPRRIQAVIDAQGWHTKY